MAGGGQTVEGPSEQEQALADIGEENWAAYKEDYRSAEKALAKKAEFTKGERAQVKGEVAADAAAAFKELARSTVASGSQAGANVASGKTKLNLAADAEAQGKAKGLGQAAATTGGEIDSDQQNVKIAALGRNLASDTQANMSQEAVRATRLALAEAEAKFQRNQGLISGLSTAAGAAFEMSKGNKAIRGTQDILDQGFAIKHLQLPPVTLDVPKGKSPFGDYDPFANMFPKVFGG